MSEIPIPSCSPNMRQYFLNLQEETQRCYDLGNQARAMGWDPKDEVEIPQAADLAARVEQLVGPPGIAGEIRALASEMGREELSLQIAKKIASKKGWRSNEEALDQAVRTGLAILTEGVLVAPLEGVAKVKVGNNSDGSEYVGLYFAGPIRSAGGTGQALSVLIADVVRRELGLDRYKPLKEEVERYKEGVPIYRQIMHLQYTPSPEEIELITGNCPVCIDGEGTEKEEVAGHRDLKRVETNRVRGGACLVLAEGMGLKAKKIQKHVQNLGIKGWEFLDALTRKPNGGASNEDRQDRGGQEKFIPQCKDTESSTDLEGNGEGTMTHTTLVPDASMEVSSCLPPETKYIKDLIAGRPVLSYPSRKGGFRLRYGRARTTGLAALAINSATMVVADDFLAVGTQLKIERPGKAGVVTPCDEIEGPIVVLKSGDMVQLNSYQEAKEHRRQIDSIVDIGEMLLPYGEFVENNHPLVPGAYTLDWWRKEVTRSLSTHPVPEVMVPILDGSTIPDMNTAIQICRDYDVPLHPYYNLFWHDLDIGELQTLIHIIGNSSRLQGDALFLPDDSKTKSILMKLGALHRVQGKEIVLKRYAYPILTACGFDMRLQQVRRLDDIEIPHPKNGDQGAMVQSMVSHLAGFKIRPRAPIRIGARMGRPEKANERKMNPAVHVLFPIGQRGGNQRLIKEAAMKGDVEVDVSVRRCSKCLRDTPLQPCMCGGSTEIVAPPCLQKIPLGELLKKAQENLGGAKVPDLKGVIGLISEAKTPEPLEKGILRARHDVSVFKDGTVRFDMTDVPLTHFRPYEIGTSVQQLHTMGYTSDIHGRTLEDDEQLLELKVQDIIPSLSCGEYFVKCASFVDDLLDHYYKLPRFYNSSSPSDLVGHLVVGLAPHTSGGVLGRIIGYTSAQVGFAHPFYHAAKRRNCLVGDTKVVLEGGETASLRSLFTSAVGNAEMMDDLGTVGCTPEGLSVITIDPETGKMGPKPIKQVLRVPSPNNILEITTNGGRNLRVSPYHPMWIVDKDGGLGRKKALEVNVGECIVAPARMPIPESDIEFIDLLHEFLRQGVPDVMIRGAASIVRPIIMKLGGYAKVGAMFELDKKTLSNYVHRDSFPTEIVKKILESDGLDILGLPSDIRLASRRDTAEILRIVPVDEKFCRLMGYYLARGYTRKKSDSFYQVSMSNSEVDVKEDMIECIRHSLGPGPNVSGNVMVLSSRLSYVVFNDVLGLGHNAHTKRIPPVLRNLPKEKARHIIAAFIAGDGVIEKDRLTVKITSANLAMLKDFDMQLRRFGIYSKMRHDTREGGGAVADFYTKKRSGPVPKFSIHSLIIRSSYARLLVESIGISSKRKQDALLYAVKKERSPRHRNVLGHPLDEIVEISPIPSKEQFLYDLEVEGAHSFLTDDLLLVSNCDGDEDCLMLLMDGLLNFSRSYLPSTRGGLMDAPLILTTRIDPNEIDKEAHNVDVGKDYPLEFYEAAAEGRSASDVKGIMDLIGNRIGTPRQYEDLGFTHDTPDIGAGPKESSYKTFGTMIEKMEAQLALAKKLSAVDEADVASKVICTHFLPDMQGNMKSFSRQKFRCTKCNKKHRRIPLAGRCDTKGKNSNDECGGDLTLTVHEGGVKKYLDITKKVSKKYKVSKYTQQRILLTEKAISSLFDNDKLKKCTLEDFL